MRKKTRNTSTQPLQRALLWALAEPSPHPPHTRGTFHRRLQPLYTEKHKVSCSGFLPKSNPMQHSCSHYIAFCKQRFQNTKQLQCARIGKKEHIEATITARTTPSLGRTQPAPAAHTRYLSSPAAATLHGKTQGFVLRLSPQIKPHATFMQPLQCVLQAKIPKHDATAMRKNTQKRTHWSNHYSADYSKPWPNPARTRRTHEVPFIAGCSHFTRKNKRFRAPGFLPKSNPMQHSCSHWECVLQAASKNNCNCKQPLHIAQTTPSLGRTQPAPAAHTRYLSSPAAATLHGKTQGFVLRLSPQIKPHATFMQPLHAFCK